MAKRKRNIGPRPELLEEVEKTYWNHFYWKEFEEEGAK